MERVREAIKADTFPAFLQMFFLEMFPGKNYPK
jgi:hypothetical protein